MALQEKQVVFLGAQLKEAATFMMNDDQWNGYKW